MVQMGLPGNRRVGITSELEYLDFEDMAALERRFYDDEFISPAAESYEWYRAYPTSVVAARNLESGKVIGFVNLFPVRRGVGEALLAGTFNDAGLTVEDIAGLDEAGAVLFFCCVVLDEAYRGQGLLRQLVATAVEPYRDAVGRMDFVVADTVTPHGARLMERFGLEFVCASDHDSRIYRAPLCSFIDHIDASCAC